LTDDRKDDPMSRTHLRVRLLAPAAAVLLMLGSAGCSDDEENMQAACDAAAEMETSLEGLQQALTPGSTVGELQDARADVDTAADNLDEAASEVAEDRADDLDQAWDDLSDAVENINADTPITEVIPQLAPQLEEVQSARQDLLSSLDCG
jgi:ABC-type transporter Mla subunit MlaD